MNLVNQNKTIIPAAAIIPTMNRAAVLVRTLNSLFEQDTIPMSIVIVDASTNDDSKNGIDGLKLPQGVEVTYARATIKGAAHQRSQALALSSQPFALFMDDDILLEPHCIRRIFEGFSFEENVGGVYAMITNQRYLKPGSYTKLMYRLLDGRGPWAGRLIGPAWNILPEDDPSLPEYVRCDWMNLGCTMYRTEVLPSPLFPYVFEGYSLFEDVTLSATVARNWKLLNARTARIYHDSQPGDYKKDRSVVSEMELVNRHYVMRHVLGRKGFKNYFKLFLFAMFGTVSGAVSSRRANVVIADLKGKIRGLKHILREHTGGNRI